MKPRSSCDWCGRDITSEPASTIEGGPIFMFKDDEELEIMPKYQAEFCCHGCAWAFVAENHRLWGLSGKYLRNHLIDLHGLSYPPGKPAGVMREDCLIIEMARNLASMFDG